MKKTILILIASIVGIIILIFFCLIYYLSNATTYMRLEPNQLIAPKNGGATTVNIDYDGFVWSINYVPKWVKVEEGDDSFYIHVLPNKTGLDREGIITVQSGDVIAQAIIEQKGKASYIKTSKTSIHFSEDGGVEYITTESDGCGYKMEYPDYLYVERTDEAFSVKAYYNDGVYKTGSIILTEDNVKKYISVTQGGKCNNCYGSGRVTCPQCWGQGNWWVYLTHYSCWFCGGSGTINCGTCSGTGELE